ncbi:hypothetical protein TSUD_381490 [Trifolium subterraneum]|uniref:CHCH domain-containing protein n=1 Tax=Trifolium subterraneum TaxID=3900 RepID=A0A2Z6MP04_TRISU|nr:hypothetical protein TSUD_381490 [Trifolium subterraneum]
MAAPQPPHTSETKPLASQQQLHTSEAKPLVEAPQPLHRSDVDDDDENVKQLDECSSLYFLMQDCVVRSNRNWKECQKVNFMRKYW